jgi:uncharacterized protein YbjT (DUF2867 family)
MLVILVSGATGNVGREVVRELSATNSKFRLMVRDPARLVRSSDAAEVVVADWDAPETLNAAFEGVDSLFLMVPGIAIDHVATAMRLVKSAGLTRVVLLSSFNVLGDPMPAMGRWHHQREQLVVSSGISFTILRPGGYMTNAFEWLRTMREGGYVLDPIGPGRIALIDPADIGAVAALALSERSHEGERYTLTGDEPLTVTEQVALLGQAIGREIDVRTVDAPEDAIRFRYPDGAPPALANALIEGLTLMRDDTAGFRTDTISRLLGRRPRKFADWCERNAGRFLAALDEYEAGRA